MAKTSTLTPASRVDMTPMVDLGFLLIISFMISILLAKPNMMKLNMPANSPEQEEAPRLIGCYLINPLYLIPGKDNRIFWYEGNETDLTTDNLHEVDYGMALRQLILKERKESLDESRFRVFILPTEEASYKNVVDILDEMVITKQDWYMLADITPRQKLVYEAKLK